MNAGWLGAGWEGAAHVKQATKNIQSNCAFSLLR